MVASLLEVANLLAHGGDGLVLAQGDGELAFGFFFGLGGHRPAIPGYGADRQVHLAFGVVEFALFADQVGLGLLGQGKFRVALLEDFLEVGEFPGFLVEIGGGGELGFFRLLRGDPARSSCTLSATCWSTPSFSLSRAAWRSLMACSALGDVDVLLGDAIS